MQAELDRLTAENERLRHTLKVRSELIWAQGVPVLDGVSIHLRVTCECDPVGETFSYTMREREVALAATKQWLTEHAEHLVCSGCPAEIVIRVS